MVQNVFTPSPVRIALDQEDARLAERARGILPGGAPVQTAAQAPAAPLDPKVELDKIAATTRVPANLLMAIGEAAGAADANEAVTIARGAADRLSPLLAAGKTPEQAMIEALGGQADPAAISRVMDRAYQIADELYPAPPQPAAEGNMLTDSAALLGRSILDSGIAGTLRGAGELVAAGSNVLLNDPINAASRMVTGENLIERAPNPVKPVSDFISGAADRIFTPMISDEAKQKIADSTMTGSILDPSTWDFGKNPSLEGFAYQAIDVFGSLAPVLLAGPLSRAAGLVGKEAQIAGAAGAAGAAGDQAQNSDAALDGMWNTILPDGRRQIEAESGTYQRYVQQGMAPEAALEATKRDASQLAALFAAPLGAVSGAILGKISDPASRVLGGRGILGRTAGRAAIGAVEEGIQEPSETAIGRVGTNLAAGTDLDPWENTLGDAVLGAMAGGGAGALGGALSKRQTAATSQPGGDAGLPPLPEDGGPTGPTGPDVVPQERQIAATKLLPGPLESAAAAAPQSTTAGYRPGARVMVDPGDGTEPFAAQFVKDTVHGPIVREEDGTETTIPRPEIDAGNVRITPRDDQVTQPEAGQPPSDPASSPVQPPFTPVAPTVAPTVAPDRPAFVLNVDGTPFQTQLQAAKAGRKRLGDNQFTIQTVPGGFAVIPNPPQAVKEPDAAPVPGPAPAPVPPAVSEPPAASSAQPGAAPEPPAAASLPSPAAGDAPGGAGIAPPAAPVGATGGPAAQPEAPKSGVTPPAVEPPAPAAPMTEDELAAMFDDAVAGASAPPAAEPPAQPSGDSGKFTLTDAVKAEMRKIGAEAESIRPRPAPGGAMPVGSADERKAQDAAARDLFLDGLRKGMAPWDAAAEAKRQIREAISRHNARRPNDTNWQVSDGAYDTTIDDLARRIDRAAKGEAGDAGLQPIGGPVGAGGGGVAAQAPADLQEGGQGNAAPSPQEGGDAPSGERPAGAGVAEGGPGAMGEPEPGAALTEDPPADEKTAFTLAGRLDKQDQKLFAANRDTAAGEIIVKLDDAARRAEAQRRADGSDQAAQLVDEATQHAKNVLAVVRKLKTGDVPMSGFDEDTGERDFYGAGSYADENGDSPIEEALFWLDQFEAMGTWVDTIDPEAELEGPGEETPELDLMPADQVFPDRTGTISIERRAEKAGMIPQEEADARLESWKAEADRIGKTGANKRKVILSLFDYSGQWSEPWERAGYQVLRLDIKSGRDILTDDWFRERIDELRRAGMEIFGVMSACPCTTFTGTGARWRPTLHDIEDPASLAKVFGERALSSGAKSALEYNIMLADATKEIVARAKPTGFHVLENPVGRIREKAKLPPATIQFQPHNFGDPYTKRTQIFGVMKDDLPLANVDPVEGSKIQSKLRGTDPLGKEERSTTPMGFAYAFFMANDPEARKALPAAEGATQAEPPAQQPPAQPPAAQEPPAPEPADAGKAPWADEDYVNRAMLDGAYPLSQARMGTPSAIGKVATSAASNENWSIAMFFSLKRGLWKAFDDMVDKHTFNRKDVPSERVEQVAKLPFKGQHHPVTWLFAVPSRDGKAYDMAIGQTDSGRFVVLKASAVDAARRLGATIEANALDNWTGVLPIKKGGEIIGGVSPIVKRDAQEIFGKYAVAVQNRLSGAQAAPQAPEVPPAPLTVAEAAEETDPNPTPAQAEAENYKTGKTTWNGLTLSVENKKGSTRSGTAPDGTAWSVEMPAHYGRILRTEGADGDHVDFYMGDTESSEKVFIFDQIDPETKAFDEHKVMLGFTSGKAARKVYEAAFNDGSGRNRVGGVKELTVQEFKDWLKGGNTAAPATAAVAAEQPEPPAQEPAPPPAKTTKADEKKAAKAKAGAERKAHNKVVASLEAQMAATVTDVDGFAEAVNSIIAAQINEIAAEYDGPEKDAVLSLLADGKPVLPRSFYETAYDAAKAAEKKRREEESRDPQVLADAMNVAAAEASVSGADETAQFEAGFRHAISGGTRSTLPQSGRSQDGYAAGRDWLKTAKGKDWFAGKTRGKKAENTGEALRRVWEINRKGLDGINADDMKKAWASLLRMTARSDWFPNMLAPDATPGAKEFLDKLRGTVATFQEYYARRMIETSHSIGKRGRSGTAETVFMGNYTSYAGLISERARPEGGSTNRSYGMDDKERVALSREVAQHYQEELSRLAEKFSGLKTLAEIKTVLEAMWRNGERYDFDRGSPWEKALYRDVRGAMNKLMPPINPVQWDAKYSTWAILEKSEANERAQKDRKDALVRPRLDKIERKGEDKRQGRPISSAELKRTFGLADVTIGEYVTSGEATDHLNYAHDAFMTLAGLLGIKPEQIGFGGRLHLAIGALGHGKHSATFHPDHPLADGRRVEAINLTKTRGDGALLHEYFHAIDFMSKDAALKKVISQIKSRFSEEPRQVSEIEALAREFLSGGRTMTRMGRGATAMDHAQYGIGKYYRYKPTKETVFYANAKKLDGGRAETTDAYWSNNEELFARAAEAWGFDELTAAGLRDDYLVTDWVSEGKVTDKTHRGTPYPTGADRKRFADLFRSLVRSMDWSSGRPVLREDNPFKDNPPIDTKPWAAEIDRVMQQLPALAEEEARRKAALAGLRQQAQQATATAALFGDSGNAASEALSAAANAGFPANWWEQEARQRIVLNFLFTALPADDRSTLSSDWFAAKSDPEKRVAVLDDTLNKHGLRAHMSPEGQARYAPPPVEPEPEPEPEPATESVDAPLSWEELAAIFDEQVAVAEEAATETPTTAPEPGDALAAMGWTRQDVQEIIAKIEGGQIILLADKSLGVPTIHDVKGADHLGFGVFKVQTPEYEGVFDAGSAMSSTSGGKNYTSFQTRSGTPPWWDKEAVLAKLRGHVGNDAKPLPDLDAEAQKTAAELAKEFAAHGVAGIEESLTALVKLFGGGPNKLQSFPGGIDEETYQAALPHLKKSADEFRKAGLSFREFVKVFFDSLVRQFGASIKPYAVRFALDYQKTYEAVPPAEPAPPAPVAAQEAPEAMLSDWVLGHLREGESFTWQDLFREADRAWNGTQANGTYGPKDAYDAVELAINRRMLELKAPDPRLDLPAATEAMAAAEAMLKLVPTQTKRTPEMDEFQQFSTPPHFAYLAAWAANMGTSDTVLEPSAGIGGLAVFGKIAGAKSVAVNELSARRLAVMRNLPFDAYFGENAEHLDDILPAEIAPTVVLMNPPFSATGGRVQGERDTMNGARHVEQALKRLRPGGRLVAIVGSGMAADRPAFKAWWRKIGETYNVRANIGLDGTTYAKYGTTFDNQILVIDKSGPTTQSVVTASGLHPSAALSLLEGIRNDRPEATQPDPQVADGAVGGTGSGKSGGRPATGATANSGASGAGGVGGGRAGGGSGGGGRGNAGGGVSGAGAGASGGRPGGASEPGRPGNDGSPVAGGGGNAQGDRGGNGGAAPVGQSEVKVEAAEEAVAGQITNSTFEPYTPKRLRIEGAVPHNTPLVESAAMASIAPPEPTYTPNLPKRVITSGLLSDAQLEAVVYAGQAHQQFIDQGNVRRGFFIGDGTGVGKGREISGIILDNLRNGRKKAVWLSKKKELMADAKRDFGDIGGNPDLIFSQANTKIGDKITNADGILFAGYSTLRGTSTAARAAAKAAKEAERRSMDMGDTAPKQYERVNQIVQWLGPDFDGVIVFDEAHEMGNAIPVKGKRGSSKPSEQALAGIALQRALPKARVVYVSATGATEVQNLAYAERLGLWGSGTPFNNVHAFVNEMSRSVSAMELVAQNLKQMGLYLARSLSFDGIKYDRLEHQLSEYQRETYDLLATGWQGVLQNLHAALKDTGLSDDEGKSNGNYARSVKMAMLSAFWGAHQRFFNQIITASQMPTILDAVQRDLEDGKSILLQLTNTNEAGQQKALAKAKTSTNEDGDEEVEELDLTPRESLIDLIEQTFPTQLHEVREDEDGNTITVPVTDREGKPVQSKEALARKAALIENIRSIRIPDSPLQMLIDRFGVDNIAEITGRRQRVVYDEKGKFKIEKRGPAAVAADSKAFVDGKKRILVFSQAGGTGFSFHADRRFKNQQQRSHFIMQAGWSADKAVQGFGRSNRTNQSSQPIYRLVMTDIPAHKRFISSIARRLEQLGALTAGQRDTAGGSIFSASDNLESSYAAQAVLDFFDGVTGDSRSIPDMPDDLIEQMGLSNILDPVTGKISRTSAPSVTQFLNRLLSLRLDAQEKVFEAFAGLLERQILVAKSLGFFDDGMKSIRHVGAREVDRQEVYRDAETNVAVTYSRIEFDTPNTFYDFEDALQVWKAAPGQRGGVFKNKKSGRVQVITDTNMTRTNADGVVVPLRWIMRTSGRDLVPHDEIIVGNLERMSEADGRALWEEENAKRPKVTTRELHMLTGGILPVWDRIKGNIEVVRIALDDGRRFIGRVLDDKTRADTLKNLNVQSPYAKMTGAQILDHIKKGNTVHLSNQWKIEPSLVSGQTRAEIILAGRAAFVSGEVERLFDRVGIITERIQFARRYFAPIDNGDVLDALLKGVRANPVDVESSDDGPARARMRGRASEAFPNTDARPTAEQFRRIADAVNREMRRTGLLGRVAAQLSETSVAGADMLLGQFKRGRITVFVGADTSAREAIGTLRHEIIHALRSSKLWGTEFGVFSRDEWRTLVGAARAHRGLRSWVNEAYKGATWMTEADKVEEVIAEMYAQWSQAQDSASPVGRIMWKVFGVFEAISNALRGNGFRSSAEIMERIRDGRMPMLDPGTDPDGPGGGPARARMAGAPNTTRGFDAGEKSLVSQALTQAMSGDLSLLGLVPGRPLFTELGKRLMGAQSYLKAKESLDALRDHWHFTTDEVAQRWRSMLAANGEANTAMMDLMHDTTLAGMDPTKPFQRRATNRDRDIVATLRPTNRAWIEAKARVDEDNRRFEVYRGLRARFAALPADFQSMYREVRDTYESLADAYEETILENIGKAMRFNIRKAERAHADRLREIDDEGLVGGERADAIQAADTKLARVRRRLGWGAQARMMAMREVFESNRLEGPYFPLTRFGEFFATVRDLDGKVVAFSRFESVIERDKFAAAEARDPAKRVETGVVSEAKLRDMVNPAFVAEVENILGEADTDPEIMDAIWQRWLNTLPELSVRRSRIHRKGTPGYGRDAFRAFGRHMFHGAHQLARLTYSMDMEDALEEAKREAARGTDPTREGLIVKEMERRHEYTMNPKGAWWSQALTSAAFIWYLSMSPAAAIVNMTQTTIVGIPILSTLNPGPGGMGQAARQLNRALLDFTRGRGHAADSNRLTAEEQSAMRAAYARGVIDKSQAHDLAGVADTGVEYSALRTKVMGAISWFFHHTERMNREITYLAAFRMARSNGMTAADAMDKAADLTWKTHFDYQNTSRPRIMQGNVARVALVFRNFQTNMLWRLFRDTYQAVRGGTEAEKREARKQLFGITAMMMLHAGISGTWLFGMTMLIASLIFGGTPDDMEEEFKRAVIDTLGTGIGGAVWYGAPGTATGISLTNRIGMPDLWFRSEDRILEGEDEFNYWVQQLLGAVPGIALSIFKGMEKVSDGDYQRAAEDFVPKAVRDVLRSYRYATEGALTKNGDPLVDEVPTVDVLKQILGFTPAQIAERAEVNNRLYNVQQRILDERSRLLGMAAKASIAGTPLTEAQRAEIAAFNRANPDYPITGKSIARSADARIMARERAEFGATLNPRLNDRLREERAPMVFN